MDSEERDIIFEQITLAFHTQERYSVINASNLAAGTHDGRISILQQSCSSRSQARTRRHVDALYTYLILLTHTQVAYEFVLQSFYSISVALHTIFNCRVVSHTKVIYNIELLMAIHCQLVNETFSTYISYIMTLLWLPMTMVNSHLGSPIQGATKGGGLKM